MSANFDEMARYYGVIAARYAALAQAARDREDTTTANYHAVQAERYIQAAREQRMAMSQAPNRSTEERGLRRRPPVPQTPPAAARKSAVLRGVGQIAGVIRHALPKWNPPPDGLHLR